VFLVVGFYVWSIFFYESSDAPVLDPLAPGPSAVGFTIRSVTRTLADGNVRTVTYFVWYPSAEPRPASISSALPANNPLPANTDAPPDTEAPYPLFVFSHGQGGTPHDSSFLHTHLASHGFVVVAPLHDCDRRAAGGPPPPTLGATCYSNAQSLYFPEISALRLGDVTAALDDVLSLSADGDSILRNLVDADRVGVGGFSYGGLTAIQAMEADQRFRAGLLLASAATVVPGPLPDPARVARATMFMHGEWDHNVTLASTWSFFEKIPAQAPDRWFIDIHRAGHFFTNQCGPGLGGLPSCAQIRQQSEVGAIVKRWATPFLKTQVAQDGAYASLTEPDFDSPHFDSPSEVTVIKTSTAAPAELLPTPMQVSRSQGTAPSPTPVATRGTVILADDLASPSGNLSESSAGSSRFTARYAEGALVLGTTSIAAPVGGSDQAEVALPGRYGDVSIAVDAALVNPAKDQYVNIACRSQGPVSQYRLTISPTVGWFQLVQWIDGTASTLTGMQTSPAIRGGTATNRLELSCEGSIIEARINDVLVASASAAVHSEGEVWIGMGQVPQEFFLRQGFFIEEPLTPIGDPIEVRFTNLVIRQK
jgi:dienelactone hydrolase